MKRLPYHSIDGKAQERRRLERFDQEQAEAEKLRDTEYDHVTKLGLELGYAMADRDWFNAWLEEDGHQ